MDRTAILSRKSANAQRYQRAYADLYPAEFRLYVRAKALLHYHLRQGHIIRPDHCEDCGRPCKPDACHWDYTEPLNVRWRCRSCHVKHDRQQPKLFSIGLARHENEVKKHLRALRDG